MKKTIFLTAMAAMLISAASFGQSSASSKGESGIVPLAVVKTSVRLRSGPGLESKILGMVNPGVLFVAEKWQLRDNEGNRSWYRIVGFLDKATGRITDRNTAGVRTPCYVSAELVKETTYEEISHSEEFILQQLGQTPYGQGFSVVDALPAKQREMVEQKLFKKAFPAVKGKTRIPVYAGPSKSSGELKGANLTGENFYDDYDLFVAGAAQSGWYFLVDFLSRCPAGWVEAGLLDLRDYVDDFDLGHMIPIYLGANVPEIMRRWGPGKMVERRAEHDWEGDIDHTVMSFDGLELRYEDYRSLDFTLTRKGAGMGGIFVGVPWCNKDYIEKNFGGTLSVEKGKTADGLDKWELGCVPAGWGFSITLVFDKQGLVSKFSYSDYNINLGN